MGKGRARVWSAALGWAVVLFGASGAPPSSGGGTGEPPTLLRLKVASFDPVRGQPPLPPHLRWEAEPEAGVFVVQFREAISAQLLARVRATGARTLKYLPERAYLVRLPRGGAERLRALAEVRWLGPVEPGWKLAPDLGRRPYEDPSRRAGGKLYATADLFPGEDPDAVAAEVDATGVERIQILRFGGKARLKLRGTLAQLEQVARVPGVSWIEELAEITPRNNTTRWVIQSFVPDATTVWDRGLHGEGQIIGHIDGRLDVNVCYFKDPENDPPGPNHRKIVAYRSSTGLGSDFHGTHTAGTAAGDQLPINGSLDFNGNAYAAKISHSNLNDITGSGTQPSNLYDFLADAHADGARLHTNSWGDDGTTAYTTWCVDIDQFSYDFEDSLVLFAVTNTSTLRTPENAKNVLAVGASQQGSSAGFHCSGGRGPTADGRRKPEIYAPGCSIVSARWSSTCSTTSATGTSMACPAVAAAGALVRQYFEEGWYPTGAPRPSDAFVPSGALTKAVLLNSTVDMTGVTGYPSDQEGWGRVLLENALHFSGDTRRLSVLADVRNAEGLLTGQSRTHTLTVNSGGEPLKLTLVFTEPPAELLAAVATVNDLDLEVVSPSGTTYLGNVFDTASGVSVPGGEPDPRNNVEMVVVPDPELGDWTVTIRASAVNEGAQGYALVASGDVEPFFPGHLRYQAHEVRDGAPLGNGDGILDPGETATLPITLRNDADTTLTGISAALRGEPAPWIRITRHVADYPDIAAAGAATSLEPHYRLTVQPDAPCGTLATMRLATRSSEGEGSTGFAAEIGQQRLFPAATDVPVSIPKKTSTGVTSSLEIGEVFALADVQAHVDIAHADIGELVVELTSPAGTTVTLHNRSRPGTADLVTVYDRERAPDGPGTMNDFDGQPAQGTWTLRVRDLQGGPVPEGTIRGWSLELTATQAFRCTPLACADPVPEAVPPSFAVDKDNPTDLRFDWPAVPGAAAYRLWRAPAPDFAEEELLAQTTATSYVQPGGLAEGGSWYYRVRAVNGCEWEGP